MDITLAAAALLPGILIVVYIFRKDKVEREPVGLIIKLIVFGALSCIPAAILETWVDGVFPMLQEGSLKYALCMSFLSAGLMEEVSKFLLLKLGSWRNKEFDYRFDGIVYGVSVACGFAMLENMLYVADGGLYVALTRAVLSVPLHAFCGAFMGYFYGMAKYKAVNGFKGDAFKCQVCAVIVPIIIHGIYDTMCFVDWDGSSVALVVYAVLLYIVGIKMINSTEADDINMCFYGRAESAYEYDFVPSYESVQELDEVHHDRVKTTNGLSTASVVCGILSFLTASVAGLPAVLAVIFGIAGKKKSGKGVKNTAATAGIILGTISLMLNVMIVMYMY